MLSQYTSLDITTFKVSSGGLLPSLPLVFAMQQYPADYAIGIYPFTTVKVGSGALVPAASSDELSLLFRSFHRMSQRRSP